MRVYLDNSATTMLDPAVLEAMLPYLTDEYGNASSIHGFGQRARTAVEEAREQLAELLGAAPREVIFTSGGTESDNFALRGLAEAAPAGRRHIITSTIEHPAVLNTCQALETRGWRVSYLPVDRDARLVFDALEPALADDTVCVSIMHANNETGTIQEISRIAESAHARGVPVHCDAVQTVGKIPLDVRRLGVDLLSLSGHKIHGPKGIGALYVRRGIKMSPLHFGGHQERSRRPGTENVAAIVGLGQAASLARQHLDAMAHDAAALRDRLEDGIRRAIAGVRVNGSIEHRLPNITNLSFEGVEGEGMTIALDMEGIAVSTGSACSSGSLEPSHVLLAMGHTKEEVRGSLRFSLSRCTTDVEIDRVLETVPRVVGRLRSFAPTAP